MMNMVEYSMTMTFDEETEILNNADTNPNFDEWFEAWAAERGIDLDLVDERTGYTFLTEWWWNYDD